MGYKTLTKTLKIKTKAALAVFVFCALLLPTYNLQATRLDSIVDPRRTSYKLALVSVRDNIPGSFTTAQSLFADENRIYLASTQGTLFVLERNRAKNFPTLEIINFDSSLTAVVESQGKLYVASRNGSIYVYEIPKNTNRKLRRIETKLVNNYGVSALAVAADGSVIAGLGQAKIAASGEYVLLSGLNEGDDAIILDKGIRLPFNLDFKATDIYNLDGKYMGTISNYFSGAVSISVFFGEVYMTKPGCCGTGIAVYNANSNELIGTVPVRYANTVTKKSNLSIIGTEAGTVHLVSGTQTIDSVYLRQLTGHTGLEDIEIRALWADNYDNFIFAASSWGNDESRSNKLPSFFVLEVVDYSLLATENATIMHLSNTGDQRLESNTNTATDTVSTQSAQAAEPSKINGQSTETVSKSKNSFTNKFSSKSKPNRKIRGFFRLFSSLPVIFRGIR